VKILKPETIIRWHRAGLRAWGRWKSRPRGGRPRTLDEIRQLIREMSVANPLWALPASAVNSLSSAWMSARPPWRRTWRKDDGRRRRAGGPLFTITPTPSRRSTCSGADDVVWASVWTSHPAAVTPRAFVAGCDRPSQCGMACPSADRGLPLGRASTLLDPRPRRCVWRCLHPAHPGHGHSRPPGLGAVANVAKMALANDDDVIKTFPSHPADQPLRISDPAAIGPF
jgi:hypothetical protein